MLAPNNNRGMTYQTDGNHISKTIGYLVGVVKLAHYLLYCSFSMTCHIPIINLNIYKSDIEKLLKCHVYEFFDPPRLASYRKQDSSRKDSTVNNWGEIIYLQSLTQTFNGVIFWTKLGKKSAKRQCKMSFEPPSLHKKSNSASFIKKCNSHWLSSMLHLSLIGGPCLKAQQGEGSNVP